MTSSKVYQAEVLEDPATKELILQFDEEMMKELDWREGDDVVFSTDEEHVTMINKTWVKRNMKKPGSMKGKN